MSEIPGKPKISNSEAFRDQSKDKIKVPKIIRFDELAVCGEEIWIENNGELYRLRRTKLGKLILTK